MSIVLPSAARLLQMAFLGIALTVAGAPVVLKAQDTPSLLFADKTALNVDATSLDLQIQDIPPREYPHVNYRSNVRFEDGAREWAAKRFMLTGNSVNKLRVTIRKGDITEKPLPVKKGFKGLFTKDQEAEYSAVLDVEVAVIDPNGMVLSSASGKSLSTRTVTEGSTEADKQQVWAGLVVSSFDELDTALIPQIRQAMGRYIR